MQGWMKEILGRSDYDRLSVAELIVLCKRGKYGAKYSEVIELIFQEQAEADRGIADDGYDVLERSVWRSEGIHMPEKSWHFQKAYGHFSEEYRGLEVVGDADLFVDLKDVLPSDFSWSELLWLYQRITQARRR